MTFAPAATSASRSAYARVPHLSALARALGVEIADPDELDLGGELLHRRDMKLADVAGADHPGAKPCSAHRVVLLRSAMPSIVLVTSATRAAQVSPRITAEREPRATGPVCARARSIAATNSSGVLAT